MYPCYTNMLATDAAAKSFNLNLNAPAVTEGMVKRISGFNPTKRPLIPSDHAEKLVGFGAHSHCRMVKAVRLCVVVSRAAMSCLSSAGLGFGKSPRR